MVIQNNIPALRANRLNGINNSELAGSLEKLSGGYAVNRAADNAAGLAVSEKMRSQIKGIKQAIRNTQDGISYIQTGEGALEEIHSILQRCKKISVESANGIYSQVDRDALQLEINELCSEVDHISETDFNGRFIFNDNDSLDYPYSWKTPTDMSVVMFKYADGERVPVFITAESLDSNIQKVVNTQGKNFTTSALRQFANDIKSNYLPQVLSRIVSALPDSSKPTVSGMEIGFNFYDAADNVLASVGSNGTSFQLNINVHHLNMNGSGSIDMTESLASTMTHEMVHAIMFDTVSNGMLGIDPASGTQQQNTHGFPGWFVEGMAEAVAGGTDRLFNILPVYNISSVSDSQIDTTSLVSGLVYDAAKQCWEHPDSDIKNWAAGINDTSDQLMPYEQGYAAVMYLGHLAGNGKNPAAAVNGDAIAAGLDKLLKDIASGKSLDRAIREYTGMNGTADFVRNFADGGSDVVDFLKRLMDANNAKLDITGINTGTGTNLTMAVSAARGAGALGTPVKLSGSTGTLLSGGDNKYFVLDLENETVDNKAIMGSRQNIYEGGSAIADGKDRGGNDPSSAPPTGGDSGNTPVPDPDDPGKPDTPDPDDPNAPDPDTPEESKEWDNSLVLQVGPRSNGLVKFTLKYKTNSIGSLKCDFDCSAKGLGLDRISVAAQQCANKAIDKLDHAINKISMMRASFGAVQNRLEHKMDNLNTTLENVTAAESEIRDTKIPEEMMNFTKKQIIAQASQSMLAQANALPQQVVNMFR